MCPVLKDIFLYIAYLVGPFLPPHNLPLAKQTAAQAGEEFLSQV